MRRREPIYLSALEQNVFAKALASRPRNEVHSNSSSSVAAVKATATSGGRPRAVPLADEPRIAQQARQLLFEGYKIHEIAHVIGLSVSAKTIRRYMSRHPAPPDTMWDFDVEEPPG